MEHTNNFLSPISETIPVMKLVYHGREFELDIEGLCKWLDASPKHRPFINHQLGGAIGQPSTCGLDTPEFGEYFSNMTDDEIEQHILEHFHDGASISDYARPIFRLGQKIKPMLERR